MDALETILLSAGVGAIAGIGTQFFGAWISGRYWIAQEKWKLRGDSYRRLFDALCELRSVYRWLDRLTDPVEPAEQAARMRTQQQQLVQFHSTRAMARAFVSTEAASAVDSLAALFLQLSETPETADTFGEKVKEALAAIEQTITALSAAAQRDFAA